MPQSEAPERIWAWRWDLPYQKHHQIACWAEDKEGTEPSDDMPVSGLALFIRADIADAEIARLRARVAELEEALEEIAEHDTGALAGVAYTAKLALRQTP